MPLEQHLRFLEHLATFHASCWDWVDTIGLIPLANRYTFFGPHALACERELGFPARSRGSRRRAGSGSRPRHPTWPTPSRQLHAEPWALLAAIAATPRTFLHGDWKLGNLGSDPDGRTVLVDWSMCGSGPPLAELAHYLALNVARFPAGHTKEDAIEAYRAALERNGIATNAWFDRQLRLCLLGAMLQLGWEKAFDDTGVELAWWDARVREGIEELAAE